MLNETPSFFVYGNYEQDIKNNSCKNGSELCKREKIWKIDTKILIIFDKRYIIRIL